MLFRYITQNGAGKRFYGKIEGSGRLELEQQFRETGHRVLLLEALDARAVAEGAGGRRAPDRSGSTRRSGSGRISGEQKSRFIQQLAILMDSGMELRSSLSTLLEQESRSSRLAGFLQNLLRHIESGESLSDALGGTRTHFEAYEIAMLRAGESVGKLPQALTHLSDLITKSTRIRRAVVSASFYPLTILFVAAIIVSILTLFVIPRFEAILSEQIGPGGMPQLTALILGASRWSLAHGKAIATILPGGFVILLLLRHREPFQLLCEHLWLRLPLCRTLIIEWNLVLFSRTFGELLHCGAPLLESLRLSKGIVKSATIRQSLEHVLQDLAHGVTLPEALRRHRVFPAMAQGLMAVGDRSGSIGEMMNRVAEAYEYQLNGTIQQMTKLLEPLLIIFLAIFVGAIVVGLFLPLVTIIRSFSG